MPALTNRLLAFFRRLQADRGGNILILTGCSILILALAIGFGIDYSRAQRLQTKLNAAADAAVLAAVDPSMLNKDTATALAAAYAMFDYQVAGLPGLKNVSRTVTPVDTSAGSLGTLRTFTITYTATSTNSFAGILKMPSLPITGSATASASQPPSMNFYVAMDTSPSMLLPTTTAGIANMKASAIWSGEMPLYGQIDGCTFACHSVNMQTWNYGVYIIDSNKYAIYLNSAGTDFYRVSCSGNVYSSGGTLLGSNASITTNSNGSGSTSTYCTSYNSRTSGPSGNSVYIYYLPSGKSNKSSNFTSIQVNFPDSYWLAQNYSSVNPGASDITLRTDAEQQAAAGVITYAYGIENQYASTTVPPVYKMQFYTFHKSGSTAAVTTSPFGTMTDVKNLQGQTFPDTSTMVPYIPASGTYTSFTSMLNTMQSNMPATSGTGSTSSPQNVLIIITDGMSDDTVNGSTSITQLTSAHVAQCNAIKATGTRIAILYTQYIPETINYTAFPTFNTVSTSNVPNVQAQLQACATQNADGTYLMQTVSTDGSVTTALNTLFAMVVQSARLTQ